MNTSQLQTFKPSETICSKVNVRPASKATLIDELAADINHNGQLQPVIIRMEDGKPAVIAGQRRRKALIKLEHANDDVQLQGLVVDVDDMEATAISLSENKQQLPMMLMDSYKAFTRLAKQGWDAKSIGQVYSLSTKQVQQTLAIGALPASVMQAYEGEHIDDDCIKLLAIAPKGRLNQWIKLYREDNAPTWGRLRSFLANDKQVITTDKALFDVSLAKLATIEDIFEDETFFADSEQFWELQRDEIDRIKTEFEAKKWVVEVIEESYSCWAYTEVTKKNGGKVLIFVSSSGEVNVQTGLLSNTELTALEKRKAGEVEVTEPVKERPEVTKKMNEYLSGYLTQAARTSVFEDYDLAQRVILVMLLCEDGSFGISHCEQFERIAKDVTQGELSKTDAYKDVDRMSKAVLKKVGTKPNESRYSRSFTKLFTKVMKLSIEDVQRALQVVLVSAMTPQCKAVSAIHNKVKPDMTRFWSAKDSPAFMQVVQGKPLLLAMLESVANPDVAELYEKSKVVDIKAVIQEKAEEQENLVACVSNRWSLRQWFGGANAVVVEQATDGLFTLSLKVTLCKNY